MCVDDACGAVGTRWRRCCFFDGEFLQALCKKITIIVSLHNPKRCLLLRNFRAGWIGQFVTPPLRAPQLQGGEWADTEQLIRCQSTEILNSIFGPPQERSLRRVLAIALLCWRDHVARFEDESLGAPLPHRPQKTICKHIKPQRRKQLA